jgi:hypothetical protein
MNLRTIPEAALRDGVKKTDNRTLAQEIKIVEYRLNKSPFSPIKQLVVGYNVQTAVDAEHHLIVAHDVINTGSDRHQLATMAKQARQAMGVEKLTAVADRGYYTSDEILACEQAGITPVLPRPQTDWGLNRKKSTNCGHLLRAVRTRAFLRNTVPQSRRPPIRTETKSTRNLRENLASRTAFNIRCRRSSESTILLTLSILVDH